nr:unnamed protein product [Rangifer tarandus platyrhynchus]
MVTPRPPGGQELLLWSLAASVPLKAVQEACWGRDDCRAIRGPSGQQTALALMCCRELPLAAREGRAEHTLLRACEWLSHRSVLTPA